MIHKNNLYLVPKLGGVYYLYSKRIKLVYIGQTNHLRKRILNHIRNQNIFKKQINNTPTHLDSFDAKPFKYLRYSIILDKKLREKEEKRLINELKPRYNNQCIQFINKNKVRELLILEEKEKKKRAWIRKKIDEKMMLVAEKQWEETLKEQYNKPTL